MVKTYSVRDVKAIQYTGENAPEILEFCDGLAKMLNGVLSVFTDRGRLEVDKGDFVCLTGGYIYEVRTENNMNTYYVEK